jgi:hypothetical protein
MGRIAVVESIARVSDADGETLEAKCDMGGGDIATPDVAGAAGDDSPPRPGDVAVLMTVPGGSDYVVVGFIDTENAGKAAEGERYLYARDGGGAPVCSIWLKSDGSIVLDGPGRIEIKSNGQVDINNGALTVEP